MRHPPLPSPLAISPLQAVRVFLEPLGHDVPADVPAPLRPGERALHLADRHRRLLSDDHEEERKMKLLYADVTSLSTPSATRGSAAAKGSASGGALHLEAEVVQEQEAEAEAEEEQEQEQEQEQEKNQEQEELVMQEPARLNFSREDTEARPWALRHLGVSPRADGGSTGGSAVAEFLSGTGSAQPPFYPWSKFAVYRSGSAKARPLQWPARLWMSTNYFRSSWSLRSHRRLKNVICAMEWQPPPIGLRWAKLEARPTAGRRVEYDKLGRSLASGKLEYSRQELEALGADHLQAGDIIEIGGAYYQPSAPSSSAGDAAEMSSGGVMLSDEQCRRVEAAFSHLDEDQDKMLSASELATIGRAVDLESVAKVAEEAEQNA